VIETELKGSNFGRTGSNLYSEESSHKFLNVRIEVEVLSKKKNWTTLIDTQCWRFPKVR
jgi:hypothetical protein